MSVMAHTRSLHGFILLAYIALNLGLIQGQANWNVTSVHVKQGEDVSITCVVKVSNGFDVVRVTKESDDGPRIETIADKQNIKTDFLETKRYGVEFDFKRDTKVMTLVLKYTGIRGEDAGKIGCQKLSSDPNNQIAYVPVTVDVPIASLVMKQHNRDGSAAEVEKDSTVTLTEESKEGVSCYANSSGSLTPPTLTMFIDGEDKTNLFIGTPNSQAMDPNGGLGTFFSEMTMTYMPDVPDYNFNGKTLECQAEMVGFEKVTTSVVMNIRYSPKVECEAYKLYGVKDNSIEMVCNVHANPKPTMTWSKVADDGQTMEPLQETKNVILQESENGPDHFQTSVMIKKLKPVHFTSYNLITSNELSGQTVTLTLTQGSTPKKKKVPTATLR